MQKKTGRENKLVIYPTYYDLWLLSCKGRRILNHGQIRLRNTKKINLLYRQNPKIKRRNEIHHKPVLQMPETICCLRCCCWSQRYSMLQIWTQNARKSRESNVGEGSGTQKYLTFDRKIKKMNLCSWSLEIKIKTFWDKNDNFRKNNEHAVKKQKTKKTHTNTNRGKKRKHRRRRGGKMKHIKTTSRGIKAKIEVFWDKARKRTCVHGVWR